MVLEATVVCIDNSEWMRNGDYLPTRLEAQNDAVNLMAGVKLDQNPENTVGIMTMAGRGPEVLVTPTQDVGKILTSLAAIKISGETNILSSIQIAQLCLKHRQNKNQKQRVVVFVGSPISCTSAELVSLGKKLKKNNVAVDVVNFGEEAENTEKLEQFVATVNSQDNSRLVTVPPGPHILSDLLITSPLLSEDMGISAAPGGGSGATGGSTGGGGFEFGVDPNMDPELAMVLRISMEEQRARETAEAPKPESSSGGAAAVGGPAVVTDDSDLYDDDELLQQAMAMSMAQSSAAPSTPAPAPAPVPAPAPAATEDTTMGDDDDLELALQMSMQQPTVASSNTAAEIADAAMQDPDFLNSVLASLPGVDPSDPRVRGVLDSLNPEKKEESK